MGLKNYISNSYPTVGPFEGTNSIKDRLLFNNYLVVIGEDGYFHGILTPGDLIEHPHKIVIDCLAKKESVIYNDAILTVLDKFRKSQCFVLPVIKENSFIGVIEKNRILSELENKVNDLYNKALISDKVKTYFLSNLSHEIRTPLNSILGFINIIACLDVDKFKSQGVQMVNSITKSADRFLLVMNDLIELSLLNAGDKISVEKNDVNIESVFLELKDYFTELASLQNIKATILYTNPDQFLNIFSDEKKLRHILYHLIDNAIKFSENNKVIYGYELSTDKTHIVFFVKNKCHGKKEINKLKMFDPFEKQENIGNNLNTGLGIGLPLVKKLTELLGGNIELKFNNKVMTFFVSIPIK